MKQQTILASNGYIGITDIKHGIDDLIKTTSSNRFKKIYYTSKGNPYFIENNRRYNLMDFIVVK